MIKIPRKTQCGNLWITLLFKGNPDHLSRLSEMKIWLLISRITSMITSKLTLIIYYRTFDRITTVILRKHKDDYTFTDLMSRYLEDYYSLNKSLPFSFD